MHVNYLYNIVKCSGGFSLSQGKVMLNISFLLKRVASFNFKAKSWKKSRKFVYFMCRNGEVTTKIERLIHANKTCLVYQSLSVISCTAKYSHNSHY